MTFDEILTQTTQLLRQQKRVSYASLKRRFGVDDAYIADLRTELISALAIARDEQDTVLVWNEGTDAAAASAREVPPPVAYTPSHLAERIRAQHAALAAHGGDGERKTITVLFADLKGSTALLENLDPEAARAVIDPALQLMMDAVHRFEGYVAQALGDGILALFGAPLAHEDHAQRAAFAAVRMQEEARRYSDQVRLKYGAPLALRVGLNTGEVVVRAIHKDDLHTDYVPVGHSINLAARMEQMATPGAVLVSEYTQRLIDGYFTLKPLGAAEIKGVERPLAVFEITGIGQHRTRLQIAARRGLTRFIGRARELAQMRDALEQARAGRGQVIGIMGEPGLGKSRLVHEFKLDAPGFAVFEAYSASHGKATAYMPIVELLKNYFQIQLQDDERTRREKVIGRLLGLDRSLEDVLPYYFSLLNIEDAESPLANLDPQTRRRRTFDALKRVTLRASLEQPLLLVFEDLHWIDSETQGFLDGLVESIGSARILLLTNYRPEYRQEWGVKTYCTQLRLAPFGREEAQEFLTHLLGGTAAADEIRLREIRGWVLERTEGTPFFMEEMVQELFEQGVLARDSHGVRVTDQPLATLSLPTTVQGVLAARIDRLQPEEKSLLQQLAVIGRDFPFGLARAVVGMPEETLHRLLDALQKKEFLYEQPAFPEVEYLFKHALTQEVAYHSLLQERRKAIHERTARAIEAAYQTELEDHYGDLAHHYGRSGEAVKALEYAQLAATQAVRRSALHDAVNYLNDALKLVPAQPDATQHARLELTLLLALNFPVLSTKGFSSTELLAVLERAEALCETAGTVEDQCVVAIGLRTYWTVRGDSQRALRHAQDALRLAQSIDNAQIMSHGYVALGLCNFFSGDFAAAREAFEAGLTRYDFERDRGQFSRFVFDAGIAGYAVYVPTLTIFGDLQAADEAVVAAANLAGRLGYPYAMAMYRYATVLRGFYLRDYADCRAESQAMIALSSDNGFPDFLSVGAIFNAWARAFLGDATAPNELREAVKQAEELNWGVFRPTYLAMLADVLTLQGENAEAAATLETSAALAERQMEHSYSAETQRLRGQLALQAQGTESDRIAEQAFQEALTIARRQSAHVFELRAMLALASLWCAQEHHREAFEGLAEVCARFAPGNDSAELAAARKLIDERQTISEA